MRRISLPELRRLGALRWTVGATPALAQLPTILTLQELRPALEGELRRSRRYERPLAVVVVVPADDSVASANGNGHRAYSDNGTPELHGAERGSGAPGDREIAGALVQPLFWAQLRWLALGSLLCGTLRESDIVSYAAERHDFVALLPECDDAAARRAVERLRQLYVSRMGIGLRAGTAVYPTEGLTLDNLIEHARRVLAQAPNGRARVNGGATNNGTEVTHA
jgi:hypothetical protein